METKQILAEMAKLKNEIWKIERVVPYDNNPRTRTPESVAKLAGLIRRYGFNQPIVVDENGVILAGHGRRLAALHLGLKKVPVMVRSGLTEADKMAWRIADNRIAEESEWDDDKLGINLKSLQTLGMDDLEGALAFDAKELAAHIDLEDEAAAAAPAAAKPAKAAPKKSKAVTLESPFAVPPTDVIDATGAWWGKRRAAWLAGSKELAGGMLDPVLAELVVRWYCPPGGTVLDPLHNDANLAHVATTLGHDHASGPAPVHADLLFACVFDVAGSFLELMDETRARIAEAATRLKPCRFAVFVVGPARHDGTRLNFGLAWRIAEAAELAGLMPVDKAAIVMPPRPIGFDAQRILAASHLDMLVFLNGDNLAAAAADVGTVQAGEIEGDNAQLADQDAGLVEA